MAKYFIIRQDYFILRSNISLKQPDTGAKTMKENKLVDLSMDFAVDILMLCETIKGHYSSTNQLERSATSIGANIHEANYAQSKADFISKLKISLKECYESEFWLELFIKAELSDKEKLHNLLVKCGTIRRILIASINTASK